MVQLKIAFLDEEEAYLTQLSGYLIRKKELFFKVWTFTEAEKFLAEIQKKRNFDAVVMTEVFWERLKDQEMGGKKILLCEEKRKEEFLEIPFVAKYQSAEKIFGQISAMLWQKENKDDKSLPGRTAELIGVYSPIHHESQMLFSMTMAQILGENQKLLYLNFMEHSGFYQMTSADSSEDIGDLVYEMMQPEYDFAAGLHRMRQTYRNFDYISPAVNPEHLSEISKPILEQLLFELKNRSGYDIVIIDFGMVFLGFSEMLPVFGSFYCLGKEGVMNRYRMEEFLAYLEKEGEHITKHINRLLLPEQILYRGESNPFENSLYGGMGDYIRRCLYGGTEVGR